MQPWCKILCDVTNWVSVKSKSLNCLGAFPPINPLSFCLAVLLRLLKTFERFVFVASTRDTWRQGGCNILWILVEIIHECLLRFTKKAVKNAWKTKQNLWKQMDRWSRVRLRRQRRQKRKKYPQHVYPTTIWSLYNPKITLRQNHTNTQKPHHYALSLKTISSVRCGHTSLQTRSSFHSQLFPPQPQTWRHTICAVWFFWIYYNVLVATHLRWTQTKTKTPKHLLIPLGSLQREH